MKVMHSQLLDHLLLVCDLLGSVCVVDDGGPFGVVGGDLAEDEGLGGAEDNSLENHESLSFRQSMSRFSRII